MGFTDSFQSAATLPTFNEASLSSALNAAVEPLGLVTAAGAPPAVQAVDLSSLAEVATKALTSGVELAI